ncbi:MAG: oligosaccharide flippase family protein [Candidatus Neomarinimicrobiota bacterium]
MPSKIYNNSKHPLFTNPLYLYFSNFSDSILLIFLLPFIARIFGPTMLGEIGLSQSIGLIFLIILEYGFAVSATKSIASNNDVYKDNFLIGQIFSFKLYLIPIIIFLAYIISILHPIFINKPYLLFISTIDAIFQSFIPSWYFKGKQRFKYLAITKFFFRFIAFCMIFLFVNSSSDSWLYLLLLASSSFLIAVSQIFIMIKEVGLFKLYAWKKIKPILESSTYNFFIILLPTIFNNIGILLLSYLANPIYLGYYYGISKIHRALNTLYTPIFESFFPYIIKIYHKDKKIAFGKMKIYSLIIFSIGFILFIIVWFLSENIIYLLLGNKFISAENYLKAFGFLLPLTVISYIWGNQWMVVLGKEKKFSQISSLSNIVGVVALFFLMPKFLIYAIPISISISEILKIIMIVIYLKYGK